MATTAVQNGNTIYVSSATSTSVVSATTTRTVVQAVIVTGNGGDAEITLSDVTTGNNKLTLKAQAVKSELFSFQGIPIAFPNGIQVAPANLQTIVTIITTNQGN